MSGVRFRPFAAEDVVRLELQPSQHYELGLEEPCVSIERGRQLEAAGPAWTAHDDARILCVAGFGERFPTHAVAWAMFTSGLGLAQLAITRFARARIAGSPYRRIEAIVEAENFRAGDWARLIGLEMVHVLHHYGAAAKPHLLFERIA